MKTKEIPSAWVERGGLRLDCGPYLSGSIEAQVIMERATFRKDSLQSVTDGYNGGIYNGPISAGRRLDSLNTIGIGLEVVEVNRDLSTVWVNMALNSTRKSRSDLRSTVVSVEPEAGVQKAECDQQHFAQSNKNNT